MEILKTSNLHEQFIKALFYGPPGGGKTTLGGSAALCVKTLIISAESGLLSLQNLKDASGNIPDIDYVQIKNMADMEAAYHFLKNEKHEYKAVVIDSLTEIQRVAKDAIMEEAKVQTMEIRSWGQLASKLERLVRSFRDLPMHLIITALEDAETDKLTGEVKVWPALQGSVQKQLPAYFDLVAYAFSRETGEGAERRTVHGLLTQNSGKYVAKDRSGKLPKIIDDPSFEKICSYIYPTKPKETV